MQLLAVNYPTDITVKVTAIESAFIAKKFSVLTEIWEVIRKKITIQEAISIHDKFLCLPENSTVKLNLREVAILTKLLGGITSNEHPSDTVYECLYYVFKENWKYGVDEALNEILCEI